MLFWTHTGLLVVILCEVTADCIDGFIAQGKRLPIKAVVPQKPKTWQQMMDTCSREIGGQRLISLHDSLTEANKIRCLDTLVPVFLKIEIDDVPATGKRDSTKYELQMMDKSYPKMKEGVGALNLSTGLWHFVGNNFPFSCALCGMKLRETLHELTLAEDDSSLEDSTILIRLVGLEVHNGTAVIPFKEREDIIKELETLLRPPNAYDVVQEFRFSDVSLDVSKHLVVNFHCDSQFPPVAFDMVKYWKIFENAAGVHDTPMLKKYVMSAENISDCPEQVFKGHGNMTINLPKAAPGTVQLNWDSSAGILYRHFCAAKEILGGAAWVKPTLWEVVRMPCTPEDQLPNDDYYKNYFNRATSHEYSYQLIIISICIRLSSVFYFRSVF